MKVPVAIIGLGKVAEQIHLPACQAVPEIELVAGCDPSPSATRVAAKFGIRRVFSDYRELLRDVHPGLVLVGTPPGSHYEICRAALESGAHVLCEKPFMPSLAEADRIIDLAERRNLLLRVNNQYRFMKFYRETKRRLDQGEFGRVYYIQAWQQMMHPPESEANWRSTLPEYVLFEFGTHVLDLLCYFFDARPSALSFNMPRCRPEFASDVLVCGMLRFPDERLASVSLNRVSHAPRRYLEMRLECEKASLRISLGGVARVSIEWSGERKRPTLRAGLVKGGQARLEGAGGYRTYCEARQPEFAPATAAHLRTMLAEMRNARPSLDAVRLSRDVLGAVLAGYESARSGETVRLSHDHPVAAMAGAESGGEARTR
jgi:predicted dehydrogenase